MRNGTLLLLVWLLCAATARAEGIRYDRIPADATGYIHMDFDPFLTSASVRQMGAHDVADLESQFSDLFGQHTDITIYIPKSSEPEAFVVLCHSLDPKLRQRLETNIANPKTHVTLKSGDTQLAATTLTFTYDQQEIHYTSVNMFHFLVDPSLAMPDEAPLPPATRPAAPVKKPSSEFVIGLGSDTGENPFVHKKPSYTAFVGQDLIVIAPDFPAIANALDVIHGKKPSLAQQDPQGLKVDAPPGVWLVGAGLTAEYSKENAAKGNHHTADATGNAPPDAKAGDLSEKGFGFDLFGSFKAKARLARFEAGQEDKQIYVDAWLTMKDAQSTEQLKNLAIGLKAMICLSQKNVTPLLLPLEIQRANNDVVLHWSWPNAKLSELIQAFEQANNDHDDSLPATAPATQPTH